MEKFRIIDSADSWLQLRLLRNAFAHECLTDNAAIAENINKASELAPLPPSAITHAESYFAEHIAAQN
jgi:hypothetical protein